MKCVLDHTRTVFIHDHDGVHYRYKGNPNYLDFFSEARGQAVIGLLQGLSLEEAKTISKESYLKHYDGQHGFYEIAQQQGHKLEEFRLKLHQEYHRVAFEQMSATHPEWITACHETQSYMQQLNGHVRHAILTQGCLDNWARPNLARIGILQHFEIMLGLAETQFHLKADSTRPIEMALDAMKAQAHECVFIEDTLKNLAKAKERFPDLCTVYICDDNPLETLPAYVDIQVDNYRRLQQAVTRIHFPESLYPDLKLAA